MDFGDAPSWAREALFGGAGTVTVRDLTRGAALPPFAAVLGCTLSPAGAVGRHVQDTHPEIVVGLSGLGEARVNETVYRLHAGDVVHLPLGSVLSLRNLDDVSELHYLIVKAG